MRLRLQRLASADYETRDFKKDSEVIMFDFEYVTPKEAAELDLHSNGEGAEYYEKLNSNNITCFSCTNKAWKLADTGMCFSCTTGETDASEDYELR